MSKNILIDSAKIVQAATMAQIAGISLDTKVDRWVSLGENSVALEAFADQFVELERIMSLLQSLVVKDAGDVSKTAAALFISDLNLAQRWR